MRIIAIAAAVAIALSAPAFAQQKTGPNGGMLAGKSGHETELVVAPTELTVYMIDGGKPHSTKGAAVKGVIQEAGKATQVTFTNVDDKKFVGKLVAPLAKGAIVVLTGKDDHGDAISARYVVQ